MNLHETCAPEFDIKRFATLRAAAALAGYVLDVEPLGCFYITRWGHMRMFDSLDEVEVWLREVAVA